MLMPLRLAPLLAALAPPLCWACGAPALVRELLCRSCRSQLRFLPGTPVEQSGLRLWAPVAYEGPARSLIGGLKYRGAAGLADALATQMAASLPALASAPPAGAVPGAPADAVPALVPVPTSPSRARRRGYDQAALLAAALSRRTGMPVVGVLRRRREGAPQVGRGREARQAALAGSIELGAGATVPSSVLLVDDVVTTAATLAACAAALRRAGCEDLAAVAYARALGR
jgi:ComF family protein